MMRVGSGLRWKTCLLAIAVVGLISLLGAGLVHAGAASVAVYARDVATSVDNGVVTVTAKLLAMNTGQAAAAGLDVVSPSGGVLHLGDVAPGGQVLAGPVSFTVPASAFQSRSLVVPVTLRFSDGGTPVEKQSAVTFMAR